MHELLNCLGTRQRRGSKPRCHWITHGSRQEVSSRLTSLVNPWGNFSPDSIWMPQGFSQTEEAELHKADKLLPESDRQQIREWWFKVIRGHQTGPSFDIAAVHDPASGKKCILLVEAKAYDQELIGEEKGKSMEANATSAARENHSYIGAAIAGANASLGRETGLRWSLSHSERYQMSNRFASACKLTELGWSVILVYLGFCNAMEMRQGRNHPFADHKEWEAQVKTHSHVLFPDQVWNSRMSINGQDFIPLIRSIEISYEQSCEAFEVTG